jgi:isocitrate lyase
MRQVPDTQRLQNRLLDLSTPVVRHPPQGIAWHTVQSMSEAGASAVGLPDGFLMTSGASRRPANVLVPIDETTRKLKMARGIARSMDTQPLVIVCTHARGAQYLANDQDPRDRRYLSGVRTIDGHHVYCGGIEASMSRALAYAPDADVVCYYSSRLDFAQAERFAFTIRLAFPEKKLGVGFSPHTHGQPGETIDPASLGSKLRQLGYDYYFYHQWQAVVFASFPHAAPWALFDDAMDSADSDSPEESTFPRPFGTAGGPRSFQRCCGGILDSPDHY